MDGGQEKRKRGAERIVITQVGKNSIYPLPSPSSIQPTGHHLKKQNIHGHGIHLSKITHLNLMLLVEGREECDLLKPSFPSFLLPMPTPLSLTVSAPLVATYSINQRVYRVQFHIIWGPLNTHWIPSCSVSIPRNMKIAFEYTPSSHSLEFPSWVAPFGRMVQYHMS